MNFEKLAQIAKIMKYWTCDCGHKNYTTRTNCGKCSQPRDKRGY